MDEGFFTRWSQPAAVFVAGLIAGALVLLAAGFHYEPRVAREVKYKILSVQNVGLDITVMETKVERQDGQTFLWRGNYGLVGEVITNRERFSK